MEKRRVKLQEQQARRREEQEQRRLALEMELNRKRENNRLELLFRMFYLDIHMNIKLFKLILCSPVHGCLSIHVFMLVS